MLLAGRQTLAGFHPTHLTHLNHTHTLPLHIALEVVCVLQDFVDAFEKLLRLNLKHQQEREIIHVVMDICMQEKEPNPFYAFLTQKFCEFHRRFQVSAPS